MRAVALVLILLAAALAAPVQVAGDADAGVQPEAQLSVRVEPEAVELRGPGVVTLAVHVVGSIRCTPGLQAPEPVQGSIVADERGVLDRWDARIEPSEFQAAWQPEGNDRYTLNETVIVHVYVDAAPRTREQTNFSVTVAARQVEAAQARCSLDGYRVDETQESVPLTVVPAGEDGDDPGLPVEGINWAPLLIAIALLAVVSVFAVKRERDRRRRDEG